MKPGEMSELAEAAPCPKGTRSHLMAVAPAEKALLLLIRANGYGELRVIFRGGLPTYAEQVVERIHLGQWHGEEQR